MNVIDKEIRQVIKENGLKNWLIEYPWLIGYMGDPSYPIWFIAENPSLRIIEKISIPQNKRTENLQWNAHEGDRLLRAAIFEAGLKSGSPEEEGGWKCYITNAIKQPDYVTERNIKKQTAKYWQEEALHWMPVLQTQIDNGNPKIFVALGKEVQKILKFMQKNGLKLPALETIEHYSYVMFRPDAKTHRGPRHPERIKAFKQSVVRIKKDYL